MKILAQDVAFFNERIRNKEEHIAKCGRICYASDNTTNANKFYKRLIKNKHFSVMRHASAYYIIPLGDVKTCKVSIVNSKYFSTFTTEQFIYVSTNEEVARTQLGKLAPYRISIENAHKDPVFRKNKMLRYTFCVNTGIDITRELNRKSPNNICEQSTRYIDFNKKLGICYKYCHWMSKCDIYRKLLYMFIAKCGEWFYKISRSKYGLNLPPEDARWCLPLDVMSKVVYTYTVEEWEHIINLRLWDYAGKSHPDVKIPMTYILDYLTSFGYEINKWKK